MFFDSLKNKTNNKYTAYSEATLLIEESERLAKTINTTLDKTVFYESYDQLIQTLTELIKFEGTVNFINLPSDNLDEIIKNKPAAIEAFYKRTNANIYALKNLSRKDDTTAENDITKVPDNQRVDLEPKIHSVHDCSLDIYAQDLDPYIYEAIDLCVDREKVSIGMLQRYLKLGFNRAARILDQLESLGVIGPELGTAPRTVLINHEDVKFLINKIEKSKQLINHPLQSSNAPSSQPHTDAEQVLLVTSVHTDFNRDGENIKDLENSLIHSCSESDKHKLVDKLISENSSATLKLIIYDENGLSFGTYNQLCQLIVPVVTSSFKLHDTITYINSELKYRLNEFSSIYVKNIETYNQRSEKQMQYMVFIVSELYFSKYIFFADSMLQILLNGNRAGIYVLFFSQFDSKRLQLGAMEDFLTIKTANQAYSSFFQDADNLAAPKTASLVSIDTMTGKQFEKFSVSLLEKNGFCNIETTKDSGDHGIDILAEKDDISYAIQCKCYSSNIGNAAVQQAHTGKSLYHKDIAVVLTNQYFTTQAQEEANALGVKLWNRDKLQDLIEKVQ